MIVKYSRSFLETLKKANVKIRKSFKQRITVFAADPYNPQLNNHLLKDNYQGYRSINVTSDWRAIYQEVLIAGKKNAYFIALGTHRQLYGK